METIRRCSNCIFFDGDNIYKRLCRVDSPSIRCTSEDNYGQWPEVSSSDWCGKHRTSPEGVKQ